MSLEAELKLGGLKRGRFLYFPVVPGRVEFAAALRRLLLERKPKIVAVEAPGFLERAYRQALRRLPEMSVILYMEENGDEDRAIYVPVEPADPFTEALRTAGDVGAETIFLEPDTNERPHLPDRYPDTYSIARVGIDAYVEAYRVWPQPRTEEMIAHASAMAWKLQGADPEAEVVVVVSLNLLDLVLEAMELPQEEPASRRRRVSEVRLLNPHPDCLAEITVEYPYLQERYEFFRLGGKETGWLDRPRVQLELLREAEAKYTQSTGEKIAHWQRRALARYTRNLAQTSNELVANVYDLAVAARSIVDDNFGWEVWQMANRYLAQHETSPLETVKLTGDEIWLNTRKLRIRRRLPRPKQRLKPAGLKARKKEKYAGEWAKQTTGDAICSYPPEDLVIEDYGRFLKKKAKAMLSEERVRVEPFTTSILDGIDIRETVRNWHQRKIYVRQADRLAGEVGAVVVIFDEDREGRYQYLTTWLGEHQNESDMAFYSTYPFANLVGPG
ncbi:MAG: hypothetical protein JO307_31445, partial [Bryobacterales bacterium]|nr:hypothetical protein [Bryobacterales bacterium]